MDTACPADAQMWTRSTGTDSRVELYFSCREEVILTPIRNLDKDPLVACTYRFRQDLAQRKRQVSVGCVSVLVAAGHRLLTGR